MKPMSYKRTARWLKKRKLRQKRLRRQRHVTRNATRPRYSFSPKLLNTAGRY